jgi:hypothetical protein
MNPINAAFRLMYMPLCRAYARHVLGDQPADRTMRSLSSLYFWRAQGYWPCFTKPRSFSEIVWSRMLFDRNPILVMANDKWKVREYVAQRVGDRYLIPLLWHGTNPADIPFDDLPSRFVLKATHGCHYNILVRDKNKFDRQAARLQLSKWLSENYCQDKWLGIEWGYKHIIPSIVIEEFIGNDGNVPVDYKFRCIHGRVEFMTVQYDRPDNLPLIQACDRNGNPIPCEVGKDLQYRGVFRRPDNYDAMLTIAEALAAGFDFIRVDLYSVNDKIYFGELTPYPSAGCIRFTPRSYDFLFGEKWATQMDRTISASKPAGF